MNAFILLLNESNQTVHAFYKNLFGIIDKLNPVFIYLRQDNVETTFTRAVDSRPQDWSTFVVDYICNSDYGKKNSLSGVEGVIDYLKFRQSVEDEIFEKFKYTKLKIDNSDFDLEKCKGQVGKLLCELL